MKKSKKSHIKIGISIFKWTLVIVWMMIIFSFSNDPAVVSDGKSNFALDVVNSIGIDLNSTFGELSNFIIRKAAHFMEYFILYVLIFNALRNKISVKKALYISLLITFLYACSDEIHQVFVPGREGRFRDVLIDTSGGIFGLLLISSYRFYKRVKNKNKCKRSGDLL